MLLFRHNCNRSSKSFVARINCLCLNNIYGQIDKKIHFNFGKHLNHIKQEIIKTIMVFPNIV